MAKIIPIAAKSQDVVEGNPSQEPAVEAGSTPEFIVWNARKPGPGEFSQMPIAVTRPGRYPDRKRRLTPQEAHVWAILWSYDYGDGIIKPGHERLARDAGRDEKYVRNLLESMRGKGWVEWRRTGRSNRYNLLAPVVNVSGLDNPDRNYTPERDRYQSADEENSSKKNSSRKNQSTHTPAPDGAASSVTIEEWTELMRSQARECLNNPSAWEQYASDIIDDMYSSDEKGFKEWFLSDLLIRQELNLCCDHLLSKQDTTTRNFKPVFRKWLVIKIERAWKNLPNH